MSRTGWRMALVALLCAGCDGAPVEPGCRCEGAVPEGTLSVACGETQCVGGAGYRCTAANTAVSAPEACQTIDPDGGVDPCACDTSDACEEGCACDTACVACACDVSDSCDTDCGCDADCVGCPDWTVDDGYCDCGCGEPDTDCPSPALSDCRWFHCGEGQRADPADPTQCIDPPAGWTCPASWLMNGYCDCGCGIRDDECDSFTIDDCFDENGCAEGTRPDPDDPAACIPNPAGWTCNGLYYGNGSCTCGCGTLDSDCPSPLRVEACISDGCESGSGPSPLDPTQCIENPPQDDWTCDDALLYDGVNCDCGCGAIDTDCEAGATAASCDAVHCATRDELDPESIALCRERCTPSTNPVGDATCTNGGEISFGGFACEMNLSRCTDFHRYEIECDSSGCVCRVDGSCVSRVTDGFCGGSVESTLNGECGWSLTDNR